MLRYQIVLEDGGWQIRSAILTIEQQCISFPTRGSALRMMSQAMQYARERIALGD